MTGRWRKGTLGLFLLLALYLGPYLYVYARTDNDVFPRVESLDRQAFDKLIVSVDTLVQTAGPGFGGYQTKTKIVDGQPVTWTEVTYALKLRVLNRVFPTYITFPALLDVSRLNFEAVAVFNGVEIMACSHHLEKLLAPTGFETVKFFGSVLRAGNNTAITVFCRGPGPPTIDLTQLSVTYGKLLPVTVDWVMTATLKGDKLEDTRTWSATQAGNVALP